MYCSVAWKQKLSLKENSSKLKLPWKIKIQYCILGGSINKSHNLGIFSPALPHHNQFLWRSQTNINHTPNTVVGIIHSYILLYSVWYCTRFGTVPSLVLYPFRYCIENLLPIPQIKPQQEWWGLWSKQPETCLVTNWPFYPLFGRRNG